MNAMNTKEWREKVKAKHNYRCAVCGETEMLETHHVLPKSHYDDLEYDTDNGIALCVMCHRAVHRHGNPRLRGLGRGKTKSISAKMPEEIGKWEFIAVFKYITQNLCPRKLSISEFFLGYELFNNSYKLSKERFLSILKCIGDRTSGEVISFINGEEIKVNPLAMEFPDSPEAEAEIMIRIASMKFKGISTLFGTIPRKITNKIQLFEKRKLMTKIAVLDKIDATNGWRVYAPEYFEELSKIYNGEIEKEANNELERWIEECCDLTDKNSWTPTRELYESWLEYKDSNEHRYDAVQKFGAKLSSFCTPLRKNVVRGFSGIRLR